MQVVYERCAGLDVHKKRVVACRVRMGAHGHKQQELASFSTMTPDLLRLVDWLLAWECTHVALESTGEYWKPIYNLLEGHLEILLVNAQHVRHVPGRKTDKLDAEWLADLLRHGLLRASFIPPRPQRELRALTRYRTSVVQERTRVTARLQKGLEDANIKLSAVVSDSLGVSARAMLEALVAGESDPTHLADLARGRLRRKITELEQALTGIVQPHHRFLLAQQLAHIDFLDEQLEGLALEIEHQLTRMSEPPASPPSAPEPVESAPASDTPLSPAQALELLDTIPGVNRTTAHVIIAELGTDMRRFPSAKHAASWAGLAPGNHESGGKRLSGRLRQGNKHLRASLVQAAWAASRSRDTYLAAQYRHLARRRGKRRAIVAVAHSLLVIAYHMLLRHQPYRELGGNFFDDRKREAVVNRLTRRLEKLGYHVQVDPIPSVA